MRMKEARREGETMYHKMSQTESRRLYLCSATRAYRNGINFKKTCGTKMLKARGE